MSFLKNITERVKTLLKVGEGVLKRITEPIILPGFQGHSLYDIGLFFFRGLSRGTISIRASSIAFNLFIAIFPGLIFLFSLIPYIPIENFHEELFILLSNILPDSAYYLMHETIVDTIMVQRSSTLSVGFILMLFFSSNGVLSMIEAFNATYYNIDTRNIVSIRLIAVFLVLILSVLIIVAISLMIVGNNLFINFFVNNPELDYGLLSYAIIIMRWILTIMIFFLAVSFLYYLAPSKKSRFKFISPGSIFSTFLIIVSGLMFSWYINNFAMYNKLYGSIGTIIIIMLLFYFAAMALILGFELNVSIMQKNREE